MYHLAFKNIGILVILLLFFTSCTSGIEIPEDKKEYIGIWTSDNMTLEISTYSRIDYSYDSGAFSSSFSGPIQEFTDEYIKAGVWLFSKTFTIDAPISTHEDGTMEVAIDGEVLKKILPNNILEIPDVNSLENLIAENIGIFVKSIRDDDFDILHKSLSVPFQRDHSPQSLSEVFEGFLGYGDILAGFLDGNITFSKPPSLDNNNLLQLEGIVYDNETDNEFHFEYVFIYEYPSWRVLSLNYRVF